MHKINFKHGPSSWTIVAHPVLASYQQGAVLAAAAAIMTVAAPIALFVRFQIF